MAFRQLSIRLERAEAERAEALLNLAGALSLSFDDAADSPLFEPAPGTNPLWPRLVIRALFPPEYDVAELAALLADALPSAAAIDQRLLEDADWHAGLEQAVFVQQYTDRLCVVPADWDGEPPAETVVRLHMGLAFGTGRHPTTALCLRWLAQHPPTGLAVCDFGCGSGVLAIAACRLGAVQAIAIDNDPQAVTATQENARLNDVAASVSAGAIEDFGNIRVDLVLANILAGTLQESAGRIAAMLRPGGAIVLSGVLEAQIQGVIDAFSGRFESFDTTLLDGWACISARVR